MTLNANYSGTRVLSGKLDGPEHALDALVGLVILVAELMIGVLGIVALIQYGTTNFGDSTDFGFGVAVFGGGLVVLITSISYLVRIVRARRSWTAPLTGLILLSVLLLVGYVIMMSGS